ncbi:MAG TPA: M1 family peptidase [Lutibacter sp.]|nr:M1 family peptidase [Lutibacter sp.]
MKTLINIVFFFLLSSSFVAKAQFVNNQRELIDIQHYTFDIEISDTSDRINAKATLNLLIKKKTKNFFLNLKSLNKDGKGMCIKSIKTKKGNPLAFTHKEDILVITNKKKWKKNKIIELEIAYSGIPEDGLYIRKSIYNKKTFFGDNWPNRAQYWLPVIDHPSDKATVDFIITAPKHFTVIASGKLISEKALTKIKNIFHFQTEQPLPTKVMVLGAADFKIKQLDTINSIPVSSWIYQEAPDKGFDDYKPAVAVLKFYDSIIGPYSYTKLANVQSKTRFGGMENAGNIFYYEESVNGKNQIESLVAHEVAHQWFGNSVTEKNWRDIWLSEGFATYLTDIYLEYKYGKEKLKERMIMEREKVIKYSKKPNVQAIVYNEKENLFKLLNRNSYEKGAWVLHMLRTKIGDDKFFEILRNFYSQYKNSNASTEDFIEIVNSVTQQDLNSFFDQWLYRTDIPTLQINWKIEGGKFILDIKQQNKPYNLDLLIKSYDKNTHQIFKIALTKQNQHFEFPTSVKSKDAQVIIDPEVTVLFQ